MGNLLCNLGGYDSTNELVGKVHYLGAPAVKAVLVIKVRDVLDTVVLENILKMYTNLRIMLEKYYA